MSAGAGGELGVTAFEAAEWALGAGRVFVTRGRTCYQPELRSVYLAGAMCFSRRVECVMEALHECGHAEQHEAHRVLFALRNFWPVRWWLEEDAWRRAHALGEKLGLSAAARNVVRGADGSYSRARVFVR